MIFSPCAKDVLGLDPGASDDPAATSASGDVSDLAIAQPPIPETAGTQEAAAAANGTETRAERFRRHARQGGLHAYAIGVVVLVALLIALAASNTADVKVNWLIGSSRVSLVWLVLLTAVIAWVLGLLASLRFQWLTRARRR
ncbi:MAG TPA: LapA family protein [Solirubrobacteraceae bacterium]|nr:LapA family protein [Solirubrobacteraceae bacterium]